MVRRPSRSRSAMARRTHWQAWPTSCARNTERRRALRRGGDGRRHRAPPTGAKCKPSRRPTPPPKSTSKCPNRMYFRTTPTCWNLLQCATATCPGRRGAARRRAAASSDCACSWARRSAQYCDGGHGLAHRVGGPEIRLPREGLDQLVPPLVGGGSPDIGLHAGTAEREQPEKHLPARGAGRLPEGGPADRRWASPISAPPTEAGTTSRIRRRAPPARASCAMSISRPPAPRRSRDCSSRTRARSAASCSPARSVRDGQPEVETVRFPQSAGRVVDPVHEPRLDQPRRHRP